MRRTGIFGGTFCPMHLGHLAVAKAALHQAGLDDVIVMPAFTSPFRCDETKIFTDEVRLEIAKLTCGGEPGLSVSDYEISKRGVSYTFDTVAYFKERFRDAEIFWIMGEDSLPGLGSWYKADELFKICRFIVYPRRGAEVRLGEDGVVESAEADIIRIEAPFVDVSSTLVRMKIENGEPLDGLLHPDVVSYLKTI